MAKECVSNQFQHFVTINVAVVPVFVCKESLNLTHLVVKHVIKCLVIESALGLERA